uniref:Uncharacterized protein n=1 Tax=Setaria viridis TaxID=4556 RepID=A0A4V6Y8V4_SETVI|nr:hypothetical protein SEVIR_2G217500v2 [Setaria viridis]
MRRKDRLPGARFRKAPGPCLRGRRGAPLRSRRGALSEDLRSPPTPSPRGRRGAPLGSSAERSLESTEPSPAVAPETQEQRSGDKWPLPDAPGSASGSEAKRARRPCSGGTATPRGLVLQLAPKKVLRVSSASVGRTAVPPTASGGVPGEVAGPTAEAAPVTVTGGVAAPSGVGEGVDPAPPSASLVNPSVQSVAPQGPQAGEVIDLDADEAEGTAATGTGTDVPAATTGTAAATEEGVSASAAAPKGAAVTEAGTSAPEVPAEVAPAAGAEVSARGAPAGAEEPASAVPSVIGAQALGPSANPEASGSTPASALATSVPRAWRGSVLRWTSREDPPRHLFTLDDAAEWRKWQAVQGSLASTRAALSSVLGELDNVVLPGSQALQECSRGKSDFLRLEQGLWERFNLERERTRELSMQVAATQGVINDLQRREQAAHEEVRRLEAKFQAVVDKARLDREEFQAAAEKARHDAEELTRLKGEHEALQKTVERIRRERQKAWQDRDAEKVQKEEVEKAAADLGAEVGQLQAEFFWVILAGEITRLREALDTECAEHGNLRDAVRVVCDGLSVVQEEGTSSLATRVLGTYRRAREIALEALHTGVTRAFEVFGSHYSGINFAGMSGGYAAGYSEAELDEIDASVFNPAEALAKLLEDEAVPPEDPPAN